jgi:hypothetical protein
MRGKQEEKINHIKGWMVSREVGTNTVQIYIVLAIPPSIQH